MPTISCQCQTSGSAPLRIQNENHKSVKSGVAAGCIPSPTTCGHSDDLSTLVQVTIVFRHGDRVPDVQNVYPNSPYKSTSFHPYKIGGLKMIGQVRMYNIGRELRKRYSSFLGNDFYQDMVMAKSSAYERCMMSMQCVLAGLFPPNRPELIPGLNWHAIPYEVIPFSADKYLSVHMLCPSLFEFDYPEEIDPMNQETLKLLQENSGYEKVRHLEAFRIYDYCKTLVETGLDLPDWLKPLYPNKLYRVWLKFWDLLFENRKRFISGALIEQISELAQSTAQGRMSCGVKLILYSGHDMNLQMLQMVLDIWNGETIDYGAYILFELHNIKNVFGFKIYCKNRGTAKLMILPGANEFIPLDIFIARTQHLYIPEAKCDVLDVDARKRAIKFDEKMEYVADEKPVEQNGIKLASEENQEENTENTRVTENESIDLEDETPQPEIIVEMPLELEDVAE